MRRWNGWGDDTIDYPLPDKTLRFLKSLVGESARPADATLSDVISAVPEGCLASHPLLTTDPEARVRHARGQSLPDWVALRSGRIGRAPDAVAYPTTPAEVRELIRFAGERGATLIPFGGGTSVVGHINPPSAGQPVLTMDLSRLSRLLHMDRLSQLATFGAGVAGPDLEAQLRALGYTLGHFPQSFEFSTLGGWIATRSCGQQSMAYGRIDELFAGGRVEAPAGTLDLPAHPASAAGPDLRALLLGSEGRFGVVTEAAMRVSPLPEREDFQAIFFPDWTKAREAAREITQAELPLSMLRLSTPVETETTLLLAGHDRLIRALEKLLAARGAGAEKCMALIGFTGKESLVRAARKEMLAIARRKGGVHIGRSFGRQWHKRRFLTPYLRNALWTAGYAVDTLETATTWARLPAVVDSVEGALRGGLAGIDEKTHVFTHLSHCYSDGSSVYVTYIFRLARDPEETLERWRRLKGAASRSIVAGGATISHQHGVGTDHLPYLAAEKGDLGIEVIRDICRRFDPHGIMNGGKLVE